MDKNMINVDDLVRQRLSGVEEQELPGSWMRMRELLDKEMPQRPAGFFWRRTMSAIAVLLLVAAISVGGYRLSSFKTLGGGANNSDVQPAAIADAANKPANNAETKDQVTNKDLATNNDHETRTSNQNQIKTDNTAKKLHTAHNTTSVKKTGENNLLAANNATPVKNASIKVTTDSKVTTERSAAPEANNNSETAGKVARQEPQAVAGSVNASATADEKTPVNAGNATTAIAAPVNAGNTNTSTASTVNTEAATRKTIAANATTDRVENMPLAANTTTVNNKFPERKTKENSFKRPVHTTSESGHNSSTSKTVAGTETAEAIPEHSTSTTGELKPARKSKHKKSSTNAIIGANPSVVPGDKGAGDKTTVNNQDTKDGGNSDSNKDVADGKPTGSTINAKQAGDATGSTLANEPSGSNAVAGKVLAANAPSVTDNSATGVAETDKTATTKKNDKKTVGGIAANKHTGTAKTGKHLAANTPAATKTGKSANKKQANNTIAAQQQGVKAGDETTTADETDSKVLAANTPSVNHNNTAVANKKATANKAVSKTAAAKPGAKKAAGNNPANVLAANTGKGMIKNGMKKAAATPKMGQRQVEKLVVTQQYVKTSATTGYTKVDTISREIVTEEYELGENSFPPFLPFGPQPYNPKDYGNATAGNANTSMETTTEVKEVAHVKKTKGSTSLENLSAAFNDIKSKFVGAHFAPGITAGINGTFFGPTSFKGFQFGFTGSFIFTDEISVSGDLKYFQRINNNYSLNDNYYSYTPLPNGQYTRELVVNPYGFSTLHSIEMPLYLRYTTGNFNFFVGGNFVYEFAINTGAYPLADPTTAQSVSTVGNDSKPQVNAQDFDSRFGIGYLLGASYQVSRKVTLDCREVQTVWDNGKSTGARIISDQLYKSPSLQLSIGYNLGGNKDRNKE